MNEKEKALVEELQAVLKKHGAKINDETREEYGMTEYYLVVVGDGIFIPVETIK